MHKRTDGCKIDSILFFLKRLCPTGSAVLLLVYGHYINLKVSYNIKLLEEEMNFFVTSLTAEKRTKTSNVALRY